MHRFWKYFILICWFYYLLIASLSIFLRGFLLTRDVLPNTATCTSTKQFDSNFTQQICTEPRQRVLLVIIDALMYDFAIYNSSIDNEKYYENKLPIFGELIKSKKQNCLLEKFIADPPTTTMQRLKALTTGSLPTFIDAGSNFHSYEITEDNFIDQLKFHNRNIVFMGDDTWSSLYPKRFNKEYPFPSFNVWDLDTVDRGIEKNLISQMKLKDWDLLIAHFLGVDHCGHRYGPNHPEMSRKLTEMNTAIRQIVDNLDNNTTLIVIGDHGMTTTGNHGGDSEAEITAALFVYSNHKLHKTKLETIINQIDIVPTLATLLGSPIPFSNLGSLIIEALPQDYWQLSLISLRNNLNQIHTYITSYANNNINQFSEENVAKLKLEYSKLNKMSRNIKSIEEFNKFIKESRIYFRNVKLMCEEIWVQFNVSLIILGLFFMILTIILTFVIFLTIPSEKLLHFLDSNVIFLGISIVIGLSLITYYLFNIFFETTCAITVGFCISIIIINYNEIINGFCIHSKYCNDKLQFVTCLVTIFSILAMFSNSFVVEESTLLTYLVITLIFVIGFNWPKGINKKISQWLPISKENILFIITGVIFCILIRILSYYWQCREEQSWCKIENIKTTANDKILLLPFLLLPFITVYKWLKYNGNFTGNNPIILIIKIIPVLIIILTFIYWVLESLPIETVSKMVAWNIQYLPMIVYILILISIMCLCVYPLFVYIVPIKNDLSYVDKTSKNILPHIFQHMKSVLNEDKRNTSSSPPAVYGLPTVYSATFIVLYLFLIHLLFLLQGSSYLISLLILFFATFILLLFLGLFRIQTALLPPQLLYVPWYTITIWSLYSWIGFYGTGHQATIPAISWNAAFVGTSGEFSNSKIIPGLMIIISTFSAHVLLGFLLPLLIITPLTVFTKCPTRFFQNHGLRSISTNGEIYLYEHSAISEHAIFTLSIKYILFQALRVCSSMFSAFILRRHLMVWKIFAPKLIFESIGLVVSITSVLLGYITFSLLCYKLNKFMDKIQNSKIS